MRPIRYALRPDLTGRQETHHPAPAQTILFGEWQRTGKMAGHKGGLACGQTES
ncbi:MAG: hypothetical protein PVJ53_12535 [Desulfobacterales bacterium]